MSTINRYEEIESWILAREQAKEVYKLIKREPLSKDFELKNQLNSSSGSVMDCIAEGFERSANGEFKYFLGVAKGSNGEVGSQFYRALDREYITKEEFQILHDRNVLIGGKINGLITYLNESPITGQRHNKKSKQPETKKPNEPKKQINPRP